MQPVTLYTNTGGFVVSGHVPPFQPGLEADVIVWGDRIFALQSCGDGQIAGGSLRYVEVFAVALVDVDRLPASPVGITTREPWSGGQLAEDARPRIGQASAFKMDARAVSLKLDDQARELSAIRVQLRDGVQVTPAQLDALQERARDVADIMRACVEGEP